MISISDWVPPLPSRDLDAHKGSVGKLLIVGGSPGLTGAIALAQAAALRSGAGLVTCAVPESVNTILEIKTTEAMTRALPDVLGALGTGALEALRTDELLARSTAVVLGPGIGRARPTTEFTLGVITGVDLPLIVDADALWHLAQKESLASLRRERWVITPHEVELRRCVERLGRTWSGRTEETVRAVAESLGAVVVAKGRHTLIVDPTGEVATCHAGNPGLASGGTGDVLAGVVGAFLARGDTPFDAAKRAVWLHARAGDYAAYGDAAIDALGRPENPSLESTADGIGEESLIASDVIATLPRAIRELQALDEPPRK